MHSRDTDNVTWGYNSDLSGDVHITLMSGGHLAVPGRDILEFVAEWARERRVAALEELSTADMIAKMIHGE